MPTSAPSAPVTASAAPIAGSAVDQILSGAIRFGEASGVQFLFGPPSRTSDAGLPSYWKRPQKPFPSFPDKLNPTHFSLGKPALTPNDPLYNGAGSYSSNAGQVHRLESTLSGDVGMSDLTTSMVTMGAIATQPEIPPVFYGPGLQAVGLTTLRDRDGQTLGTVVASARGQGIAGWNVHAIVVMDNGLVGVGVTNTAFNNCHCRLPANLIPMSVCVNSENDFAYVGCLNRDTKRAEIAVIALCGLGDQDGDFSLTANHPRQTDWWGEWHQPRPGMVNLGNWLFMKFVGTIPLDSLALPTSLSATSAMNRWYRYGQEAGKSHDMLDFRQPAVRARLNDGGSDQHKIAKSSILIVADRTTRKLVFVDLRPMVAYTRKMYFGSQADVDKTMPVGDAADVWPHTFDFKPEQRPRVIKTVTLDKTPVVVHTSQLVEYNDQRDENRAWVGCEDGTLLTYSLGDFPIDHRSTGSPNPDTIRLVDTLQLGANITGIRGTKPKVAWNYFSALVYPNVTNEIIVTSRQARAIQWVRFDPGHRSAVVRTLRDLTIKDPIVAEDNDNQGSEYYLLAIADFAGKKVHSVRYGPAILWSYPKVDVGGLEPPKGLGMGQNGQAPFELAEPWLSPTEVINIDTANVS